MQPMSHNPAAAAIGSQVVANGARGLAGGTAASAEVTALMPAGADEVSAQAAMAFATEGMESMALNAFAQEELSSRRCRVRGGGRNLRHRRRRQRQRPVVIHSSTA